MRWLCPLHCTAYALQRVHTETAVGGGEGRGFERQATRTAPPLAPSKPYLQYPTSAYVVVNGVKTHLNLQAMPPLTPRQVSAATAAGPAPAAAAPAPRAAPCCRNTLLLHSRVASSFCGGSAAASRVAAAPFLLLTLPTLPFCNRSACCTAATRRWCATPAARWVGPVHRQGCLFRAAQGCCRLQLLYTAEASSAAKRGQSEAVAAAGGCCSRITSSGSAPT